MKELLEKILKQQKEILFRLNTIEKTISERSDFSTQRIEVSLEIIVTDYLRNLRVPAHISGYSYLRTAIMMIVENPNLKKSITTKLYSEVAKQYNTTKTGVEKAIRLAIETSWPLSSADFRKKLFVFTVKNPTSSEFICSIADDIQIHYFS